MPDAVIRLENVYKAYRTSDVETWALSDISLSVQPYEFTAITGPSGCGKSTLMNVLGLLDCPDRGQVSILGQSVGRRGEGYLTALRRGAIGFIFQNFNLIEELTVGENVEMPLIYLGLSRSERKARVEVALEDVNLSHRRNHKPSQLSGGQQQRVAIARALVLEPRIVLADEPTGNLDSENSLMVIAMLRGLAQRGTAVIMVTHAPELAALCDRNVMMRDGRIVERTKVAA